MSARNRAMTLLPRLAKTVVSASAAGVSIGVSYNTLKRNPERKFIVLKRAAISGSIGVAAGLSVALLSKIRGRRTYALLLSTSNGLTWFVLGGGYWLAREVLSEEKNQYLFPTSSEQRAYYISAFSGLVTGYAVTLIFWTGIPTMITVPPLACAAGAIGHVMYARFSSWKIKHYLTTVHPEYEAYVDQLAGHQKDDDYTGGVLLKPYRALKDIAIHIYKRCSGEGGNKDINRQILEMKMQLRLLEQQEAEILNEIGNAEERKTNSL